MTITNRYSKEDLEMFRNVILGRITKEESELQAIEASLVNSNQNIAQDRVSTIEDSPAVEEHENLHFLITRKKVFIQHLKNALVRIRNGVYGICTKTGKLIDKQRLLAAPHTTHSVEAKQMRDAEVTKSSYFRLAKPSERI